MGVLDCTRIEFILAPEESPDLHFGVSRGADSLSRAVH